VVVFTKNQEVEMRKRFGEAQGCACPSPFPIPPTRNSSGGKSADTRDEIHILSATRARQLISRGDFLQIFATFPYGKKKNRLVGNFRLLFQSGEPNHKKRSAYRYLVGLERGGKKTRRADLKRPVPARSFMPL
jgi:hypothetical protein